MEGQFKTAAKPRQNRGKNGGILKPRPKSRHFCKTAAKIAAFLQNRGTH